MKKLSRITSLLLAFIMIVGMLASCNNDTPPAVTPDDTTAAPSQNDQPSGEEKILPDLPDVRYDGYEYRIRVIGDRIDWPTIGINAESKTGEPINDATLERNNFLEDKYGITISTIEGSDVGGAVVQAALSQVDEFDIAVIPTSSISAVAPNSVYDFKQLNHIDLQKPWYDQNFNKEVSVAGRLYAVTGDFLLNDDNGTWTTIFNKTLAADFSDIPNLYQLALDGKWTIDKLYEYAKLASSDITGDQIMDENDRWGYQNESFNAYAMVASTGEKIASKDENDLPYLTAGSEKFQDVFRKAVEVFGDASVSFCYEDYSSKYSGYEFFQRVFLEGRVLMKLSGLYDLTWARNMEDEIGVLPMPKYEENQLVAKNPVTNNCTCVCMPITVSDVERSAILTEALFAESRYTTRIAFYETTLKKKYSPDEETKLVLDQVIENRIYDLGAIYGWGGVLGRVQSLMANRNPNFASSWKSLERVATSAMNKAIKDFQKAENAAG